MPQPVVARAWDLLGELEKNVRSSGQKRQGRAAAAQGQLSLFNADAPAVEELRRLKVDEMTPLEALNTLYRLQKLARGEK
jgi:DNA mismatch repair protein MutS